MKFKSQITDEERRGLTAKCKLLFSDAQFIEKVFSEAVAEVNADIRRSRNGKSGKGRKYRIVKDAYGRHQAQRKKYSEYENIGAPDYSFEKVDDFLQMVIDEGEENEL